MTKSDILEFEGTVLECLPNMTFKVDIGTESPCTCTLAGKLKMNFIRVIVGDKVTVQTPSSDTTKGRITWRTK